MNKQITDHKTGLLIIDLPPNSTELKELLSILPEDSFAAIEPKNFDGSTIVHVFIELAKISLPAIVTYLIAKRNLNTVNIKYHDEKISAEINTTLNSKSAKELQLQEKLEEILRLAIADKVKGEPLESDN